MFFEGGFDHGPDVPQERDVFACVALGDDDGEVGASKRRRTSRRARSAGQTA